MFHYGRRFALLRNGSSDHCFIKGESERSIRLEGKLAWLKREVLLRQRCIVNMRDWVKEKLVRSLV